MPTQAVAQLIAFGPLAEAGRNACKPYIVANPTGAAGVSRARYGANLAAFAHEALAAFGLLFFIAAAWVFTGVAGAILCGN